MIDVILTSNKAVLPLFLFLTSPVVHFLSRLPKKVYSWFFYNKNEYDSANDIQMQWKDSCLSVNLSIKMSIFWEVTDVFKNKKN